MSFIPADIPPEPPPEAEGNMERWAKAGIHVFLVVSSVSTFLGLTVYLIVNHVDSESAKQYSGALIPIVTAVTGYILGKVQR